MRAGGPSLYSGFYLSQELNASNEDFFLIEEPKQLKILFKVSSELALFYTCTNNYSTSSTAEN